MPEEGINPEITVVGGAALLLHGIQRSTTQDVDARVRGDVRVLTVAEQLGHEFGLPLSWFSTSVSGWVPPSQGDEIEVAPGIVMSSERTLLAMKVVAARTRDLPDIVLLCQRLGVRSQHEIADLVAGVYGDQLDMMLGPGPDELHRLAALVAARVNQEG